MDGNFGNPRLLRGSRIISDHWLVILTNDRLKWGPCPFRFENMWLDHPSFKANLLVWWNERVQGRWEGYRFMEKLKSLKGKLKGWNREVFGDMRLEKKKAKPRSMI